MAVSSGRSLATVAPPRLDGTRAMEFDPEILIEEVRKRPAVWDISCDDYRAKDVKVKCWREIAAVFDPNQKSSKRDRAELVRQVQRKFKSLRDCFGREVLRRRQPRSQRRLRRTYMYYRQLSFLLAVRRDTADDGAAPGAVTPRSLKLEPQPDAATDDSGDVWREPSPLHKRKPPRAPASAQAAPTLAPSCGGGGGGGGGSGESERMFLLSLVEPLRQVPARMRLAVQMDMMSVIQNALNHPELVLAGAAADTADADADADDAEEDDDD